VSVLCNEGLREPLLSAGAGVAQLRRNHALLPLHVQCPEDHDFRDLRACDKTSPGGGPGPSKHYANDYSGLIV
jgi:hypothetical protein